MKNKIKKLEKMLVDEDGDLYEQAILEYRRCFKKYNINLYKKYGPSNPSRVGKSCKNSIDGVCYMLTCNCLIKDDKIIKNKCDICENLLPTKKDCWRFPYWNGGFIGCYCKEHFKRESQGEMKMLCDIMELIRDKNPIIDDEEMYEI